MFLLNLNGDVLAIIGFSTERMRKKEYLIKQEDWKGWRDREREKEMLQSGVSVWSCSALVSNQSDLVCWSVPSLTAERGRASTLPRDSGVFPLSLQREGEGDLLPFPGTLECSLSHCREREREMETKIVLCSALMHAPVRLRQTISMPHRE